MPRMTTRSTSSRNFCRDRDDSPQFAGFSPCADAGSEQFLRQIDEAGVERLELGGRVGKVPLRGYLHSHGHERLLQLPRTFRERKLADCNSPSGVQASGGGDRSPW